MTRKTHVAVLGAALLAVAGCTHRAERRMHDTYHDVFGSGEREGRQVDLNTASQRELARLPGLTDDDADRIIANRPYGSPRGLLRKRVIGERKYEQIQDYVFASQPGRETSGRYRDED